MGGLEAFFLYGTLFSATVNHLVWTKQPSEEQLSRERYWEIKVKEWKLEREREREKQLH